jgi:hypothetical protein
MEILKSIEEIRIANCIKQAIEDGKLVPNGKNLSRIKKQLREEHGLIFLNIISSSRNGLQVMAKTKSYSYTYNYNGDVKEISLIGGIRKNVSTN